MMTLTKIQLLRFFIALLISNGCTRAPQRIIEGSTAAITEIPHQVSIQTPAGFHFCGGTIIDPLYILTAAHCIVDDKFGKSSKGDMQVVTGTNDKLNRTSENVFPVIRRVHHAHYSWADSARHDLAILKLTRPIPVTAVQRPALLPSRTTLPGTIVTSSGWGAKRYDSLNRKILDLPQLLQKMKSPVLEQDECQKRFLLDKIYPEHICTLSDRGAAPCDGDSGGPVTDGNVVVAVISWGIGCVDGYPEVGVRVHNYVSWIQEVISILNKDDHGFISNSNMREVLPVQPSVITT